MKQFIQHIWKAVRVLLAVAAGAVSAIVAVKGGKWLFPVLRSGLIGGDLGSLLTGTLGLAALTYTVIGLFRLMLYAAPGRMERALCDRLSVLACLVLVVCLVGGMATGLYMLIAIHRAGGGAAYAAVLRFISLGIVFTLPEKAFMHFTDEQLVRTKHLVKTRYSRTYAGSYSGGSGGYGEQYRQYAAVSRQDADAFAERQRWDSQAASEAFSQQQLADMHADSDRFSQSCADESLRCNQAANDAFMQNANDFAQSMNSFGF